MQNNKVQGEYQQLTQKSLLQRYFGEDGILNIGKKTNEDILRENYQESPLHKANIPIIGEHILAYSESSHLKTDEPYAIHLSGSAPASPLANQASQPKPVEVIDTSVEEATDPSLTSQAMTTTTGDSFTTNDSSRPQKNAPRARRKALPQGWSDVLPVGYVHGASTLSPSSPLTSPLLTSSSALHTDSLSPLAAPQPTPTSPSLEGQSEVETPVWDQVPRGRTRTNATSMANYQDSAFYLNPEDLPPPPPVPIIEEDESENFPDNPVSSQPLAETSFTLRDRATHAHESISSPPAILPHSTHLRSSSIDLPPPPPGDFCDFDPPTSFDIELPLPPTEFHEPKASRPVDTVAILPPPPIDFELPPPPVDDQSTDVVIDTVSHPEAPPPPDSFFDFLPPPPMDLEPTPMAPPPPAMDCTSTTTFSNRNIHEIVSVIEEIDLPAPPTEIKIAPRYTIVVPKTNPTTLPIQDESDDDNSDFEPPPPAPKPKS